jgi:hypothetical protein
MSMMVLARRRPGGTPPAHGAYGESEMVMPYFTEVCEICPDKVFIDPDTRKHAGTNGAGLDAAHTAVPVGLSTTAVQRRMLNRAIDIVLERVPDAVIMDLETSDQDSYGFVLRGLVDAAGNDLLPDWAGPGHPLAGLDDDVTDELSDLDWDGVVGEDDGGYATIDLLSVVAGR